MGCAHSALALAGLGAVGEELCLAPEVCHARSERVPPDHTGHAASLLPWRADLERAGELQAELTFVLQDKMGRAPPSKVWLSSDGAGSSFRQVSFYIVPMVPSKFKQIWLKVSSEETEIAIKDRHPLSKCGGPPLKEEDACPCTSATWRDCLYQNGVSDPKSSSYDPTHRGEMPNTATQWRLDLNWCDFLPPTDAKAEPYWVAKFKLSIEYKKMASTEEASVPTQPGLLTVHVRRAPPPLLQLALIPPKDPEEKEPTEPAGEPVRLCDGGVMPLPWEATSLLLSVRALREPCDGETASWALAGALQYGCKLTNRVDGVSLRCVDHQAVREREHNVAVCDVMNIEPSSGERRTAIHAERFAPRSPPTHTPPLCACRSQADRARDQSQGGLEDGYGEGSGRHYPRRDGVLGAAPGRSRLAHGGALHVRARRTEILGGPALRAAR